MDTGKIDRAGSPKKSEVALAKLAAVVAAKHPLATLEKIAKNFPEIRSFTLVAYQRQNDEYGTQFRDRETYEVAAENIVKEGARLMLEAATNGCDMVIDSRVQVRGSSGDMERHIPMFDWALPTNNRNLTMALSIEGGQSGGPHTFEECVCFVPGDMDIYESGRSYHSYCTTKLMDRENWLKFLGGLLVLPELDLPLIGRQPIADARWVGHRLMQGSGALRITATNPHYLKVPELIKNPSEVTF